MTRFYVDKNLQIRASETGWPAKPIISAAHIYEEQCETYDKALEKAKSESFPVPRVEFVNAVTGRSNKLKEAIECIETNYKPDTFIDVDVSISTRFDQNKCGCTLDCRASLQGGKCKAELIVSVSRLKPQTKDVADSALPDANDKDVASIPSAPFPHNPQVSGVQGPWSITPEEERIQMGRCCQDMHKENEQLRDQLAAAEKRVKPDIQTLKDACTEFFFWWTNSKGTNTYQGFDEWAKTEKGAYRVGQLTNQPGLSEGDESTRPI